MMIGKLFDGRWGALCLLSIAAVCCWTAIQPSGIGATQPTTGLDADSRPCVECTYEKILAPQTGDPERDAEIIRKLSDAQQQQYRDEFRRQKLLTWRQWKGTDCGISENVGADKRAVSEYAAQCIAKDDLGSDLRKKHFARFFEPNAETICVGWNVQILEVEEFAEHMMVLIKANPKLSSMVLDIPRVQKCSIETWKLSSDAPPVCVDSKVEGWSFLIGL